MKTLDLGLVAGIVLSIGWITPPRVQAADAPAGARDFAFLVGDWSVQHRRLKPGTGEWVESVGSCSNREVMAGAANLEEHALNEPNRAYRALGLRSFDAQTGEWSIWWLDGRYPGGPLDPPVKGHFENGVGHFFGDYTQDGKPMRVRFVWSHITPTSARWEQAASSDGGQTWTPNWVMQFRRVAPEPR